jgi:hypothetical protein
MNAIGSRECPNREYGPTKTLYNRWKRWSGKGVFARIMAGLAAEGAEYKTIMIPSGHHLRDALPGSGRNLFEGAPHGFEPAGTKGGVLTKSGARRAA